MLGRHPLAALVLASAAPVVASSCAPASPSAPAMPPALKPLVDAAVDDLARRLRIAAQHIRVVEARAVVWPDPSLGCPRPGRVYPQVLQEGVFIRLRAHGSDHPYHGGGKRAPFLCDSPARQDPPDAAGGSGSGAR
jgi:hypothetical protein